jgi:hypothetical protein
MMFYKIPDIRCIWSEDIINQFVVDNIDAKIVYRVRIIINNYINRSVSCANYIS